MDGPASSSSRPVTSPELPGPMKQPYQAGPCPASLPTLAEAWEMFVAERRISLCATTLTTDYAQAGKWIRECPVQDLANGRQVLAAILQREPVQSARRVTMFIRSMYKWASSEDVGILERNPVANFRLPKAPQRDHEVRVILREEIPIAEAAMSAKVHHRMVDWSLYFNAQLQTGARTGEVRAMKWSDIDGSRIRIHSNYTLTHGHKPTTKTNKARWVPLNQRMKQVLEGLPQGSEYIFPWDRQAYQCFFRRKMQELHQAGLIKFRYRPYDLRHTAISRWLEAGIPVSQIASWAGNTSEVIWKHYAGTTTEYEMPDL